MDRYPARLELEDGTLYSGFSFGSRAARSGEVVFTTSMVGYPESLTDPSYEGQILAFTFPHVGNYGVHGDAADEWGLPAGFESGRIHAAGVVLSQDPSDYSHWSATQSLAQWLAQHDVPGIWGVDTRALTKRLREGGSALGRIVVDERRVPFDDPNARNLVAQVSRKEPADYGARGGEGKKLVVVLDCGCKHSIVRSLLSRGVRVRVVPWDHDLSRERFDGLVLSNGPGDPAMLGVAVMSVRAAMARDIPVFGVCLGNQLLARAAGASTYKLPYGHRSHNQPCVDVTTGRCYITSQNHGFAVDESTLPHGFVPWFVNANDGTNEGIMHVTKPFFSVQFHPEACGGPLDTQWLFDRFLEALR